MTVFAPANDPTINSSKDVEYKILRADFGDGYSQRAADGTNNTKRRYNVVIEALTESEAEAIEDFFDDHNDGSAFEYTFPGESTQRKFICLKYKKSTPQGPLFTVSAEFEEVFDL